MFGKGSISYRKKCMYVSSLREMEYNIAKTKKIHISEFTQRWEHRLLQENMRC